MIRRTPRPPAATPARGLLLALVAAALAACATAPAGALVDGREALLEGTVTAVDTTPWTYDGNAVVTVTTANGTVRVQLPARWNLCKAPPPDDVQALQPGDRVHAAGTAIGADSVVVCAQPQHHLRRLP
ncbi:hypothetical protein [Lysobacter solisilvae (ex Woo and Kim 2020)]|uniref:DUF5666 domain-containing protein n=1 Tax=Agrilutibacter terrestris TaxID=2865112 RepID=A0A7H0G077_9GAMM|nr:hypothetical protein [Lysobacter terrestris]QNP41693.1 hypothetical protein H8B22_05660 [Lysobacter terrestris]